MQYGVVSLSNSCVVLLPPRGIAEVALELAKSWPYILRPQQAGWAWLCLR